MGLLSWLLGRDSTQKKIEKHDLEPGDHINGGELSRPKFVRLRSRDFFGQFIQSPNGKFALGWRDTPDEGGIGGFREKGHGRYLLIEAASENVLAEGQMARPNDGKVANDGTFILNDWGFGSELSGTFSAFRMDGSEIIARKFKANLFNNGLSNDGRIAACHTCNADSDEDSSLLAVFDLTKALEVGRWHAESGWPDSYEFNADGNEVGLGYRDLGVFRYSLRGEFVDREKWINVSLTEGRSYQVVLMAERLLKNAKGKPSPELADRLLPNIDRALRQMDDKRWEALAWRLRGNCLEGKCAFSEALRAYDNALRINPKIGIKRRADQLRKLASK